MTVESKRKKLNIVSDREEEVTMSERKWFTLVNNSKATVFSIKRCNPMKMQPSEYVTNNKSDHRVSFILTEAPSSTGYEREKKA